MSTIVYHGSTQIVEKPDIDHSTRNLDFGKGFYVTTSKEQAERWANRKSEIKEVSTAVVNEYEMSAIHEHRATKTFDDDLIEWIDFVCKCRDGEELYKQFDVICGKVANDKVYRVVDFYRNGIWDRERAIKEIKTYENYNQIAFITRYAIVELLEYKGSYNITKR